MHIRVLKGCRRKLFWKKQCFVEHLFVRLWGKRELGELSHVSVLGSYFKTMISCFYDPWEGVTKTPTLYLTYVNVVGGRIYLPIGTPLNLRIDVQKDLFQLIYVIESIRTFYLNNFHFSQCTWFGVAKVILQFNVHDVPLYVFPYFHRNRIKMHLLLR